MVSKIKTSKRRAQPEQQPAVMAFRPMKPRPFGQTKTVVATAFDQAGGVPAVAAFLERGVSTVYGYADESAATTHLSFEQARRLTQYRGVTAFAEDFAALAGGVFLPMSEGNPAMITKLAAEAQMQSGDLGAAIIRALEDGVITKAERTELQALLSTLIRTLVEAQHNLIAEGGDKA